MRKAVATVAVTNLITNEIKKNDRELKFIKHTHAAAYFCVVGGGCFGVSAGVHSPCLLRSLSSALIRLCFRSEVCHCGESAD